MTVWTHVCVRKGQCTGQAGSCAHKIYCHSYPAGFNHKSCPPAPTHPLWASGPLCNLCNLYHWFRACPHNTKINVYMLQNKRDYSVHLGVIKTMGKCTIGFAVKIINCPFQHSSPASPKHSHVGHKFLSYKRHMYNGNHFYKQLLILIFHECRCRRMLSDLGFISCMSVISTLYTKLTWVGWAEEYSTEVS